MTTSDLIAESLTRFRKELLKEVRHIVREELNKHEGYATKPGAPIRRFTAKPLDAKGVTMPGAGKIEFKCVACTYGEPHDDCVCWE